MNADRPIAVASSFLIQDMIAARHAWASSSPSKIKRTDRLSATAACHASTCADSAPCISAKYRATISQPSTLAANPARHARADAAEFTREVWVLEYKSF